MAQHDMNLANATGANFRSDANAALEALVTLSSGATEPTDTFPFQLWADTTTGKLKIRNDGDTAWVEIGTMASANLGLLPLAGGTLTGILLAKNTAAVATPDIAFAGDPNTGLYSSGADLLGLVAGGVEVARADGILGYLKLLGTAGLLVPSGSTAQRPAGAAGLIRFNNSLNQYEAYNGSVWGALGGGGGGAGFAWKALSGTAPVESEEYGELVQNFTAALAQELYATIKVPQSYSAGSPISLYASAYSPSASGTILLKAQSTLVRPGVTAFDSTTNQRTTTNAALTNTVANMLREFILDITDSAGAINSVPVAAGDIIKVRLYRDATDTDTADLRFIPNSTDVKYS